MSAFVAPGRGGYNGPRVAVGQPLHVSPEVFGAEKMAAAKVEGAKAVAAVQGDAEYYRGLQQFGKNGLQIGLTVLSEAQKQQRICDTAVAKDAFNKARMEGLQVAEGILRKNGAGAQNATQEMDAAMDAIGRKYGHALSGGNIERQRMFSRSMEGMKENYGVKAERHRVNQMRAYEKATREAENAAFDNEFEALLHGTSALSGDGNNAPVVNENGDIIPPVNIGREISTYILKKRENVAAELSGMPENYIRMKQDEAEAKMHAMAVNALTDGNPRTALEYLNQPEVREVMPAKSWHEARENVAGIVEASDVAEDALASAETMSQADVLRKAYTDPRYRDNPKAQKQFLAISSNAAEKMAAFQKVQRGEYVQSLEDEFAQSGYQVIPPEAIKDRKLYAEMLDFQKKIGVFGKENPVANEDELISLYDKTPEEINDFLSDGKNYSKFLMWSAGDSGWKSAILEKRKGSAGDETRSGKFGGVSITDQIGANFPAISYTVTTPGFLWGENAETVGGEEYDNTNPEHKRTKANIMSLYRERWNNAELYKGEKPEERAKNILFDIIREHREGDIDLGRPMYDDAMEARLQDRVDNPVVESVNPATGRNEVTVAENGSVHTFEKIDTEVIQNINPGIQVSEALRVPDTAEAGEYKGVAYSPGDYIVTASDRRKKSRDSFFVLDANMNLKPESVDIGLSTAVGAVMPEPAEQYAAPPKTEKMLAWEQAHGAEFKYNENTGRYIAETVNAKGDTPMFYEAMPAGEIVLTDTGFTPETFYVGK